MEVESLSDITFSAALGILTSKVREVYRTELAINDVRAEAISDYGQRHFTVARMSIEDYQCKFCAKWAEETDIEEQVAGTCRHRWSHGLHAIAVGYGKSPQEAVDDLERALNDYDHLRAECRS